MGKIKGEVHEIRENILPVVIVGQKEFAAAFGISSAVKQEELRRQGMPCYNRNGTYFYDPIEVLAWMKKNFRIQKVELT